MPLTDDGLANQHFPALLQLPAPHELSLLLLHAAPCRLARAECRRRRYAHARSRTRIAIHPDYPTLMPAPAARPLIMARASVRVSMVRGLLSLTRRVALRHPFPALRPLAGARVVASRVRSPCPCLFGPQHASRPLELGDCLCGLPAVARACRGRGAAG